MTSKVFQEAAGNLADAMRQYKLSDVNVPAANLDFWNNSSHRVSPNCHAYAVNVAPVKPVSSYPYGKFMHFPGEVNFWKRLRNEDVEDFNSDWDQFLISGLLLLQKDIDQSVKLFTDSMISDGLFALGAEFSLAQAGSTIALFFHDRNELRDGIRAQRHDYHFAAVRRQGDQIVWAHKIPDRQVEISSPGELFQYAEDDGYNHFVGYFHCPNDLGFPSVG